MRFPGVDRFRPDVLSLSLWQRVVITLPFLAVTYVLTRSLVLNALDAAPAAAMVFFLLGLFLFYAVPFLRVLWRPSVTWKREQLRTEVDERHEQQMARRRAGEVTAIVSAEEFGPDSVPKRPLT